MRHADFAHAALEHDHGIERPSLQNPKKAYRKRHGRAIGAARKRANARKQPQDGVLSQRACLHAIHLRRLRIETP
jgi:hypothetical protein